MARVGRLPRYRVIRLVVPPRLDPRKILLLDSGSQTADRSSPSPSPSSSSRSGGGGSKAAAANSHWTQWGSTKKFVEGSATAFGSILILGLAGYSYHAYYKSVTLRKVENAFSPGYSSLELAALRRHTHTQQSEEATERGFEQDGWIERDEQAVIDGIIDGSIQGQYHLITGEKGTGKMSMLLNAMRRTKGDGIAMLEAHSDLEIFRIRLGKALDYEFHEDYIGGLFSFKGPRDTTPLLDIERAFNKMEKIALKRQREKGKPLVLIINGVHLLRDDEDGQDLLELIQQRAELWAASRLVNVVLISDDFWITERLMWQATRLRVIPVHDIPKGPAIAALKRFRRAAFQEDTPSEVLEQVYSKVGGRLRFLSRAARSRDMVAVCDAICEREKKWLLNQCWILGQEMDDAAEEQQDRCAAAMIVAKVLVEKEKQMRESGQNPEGRLPRIPLHEARQIMTRPDFIQHHDRINIFTIDSNSMVQADSVPMQNAFRDICSQPGFDEHLQATIDRLDELESLGRTRELTLKELSDGGEIRATLGGAKGGRNELFMSIKAVPSTAEKNGE